MVTSSRQKPPPSSRALAFSYPEVSILPIYLSSVLHTPLSGHRLPISVAETVSFGSDH